MMDLIRKIRIHGVRKSLFYAAFELKRMLVNRMLLGSYGLDGEDLIIDRLSGRKASGIYVDVGACDPTRFSNTRMFYQRGWRGINIDANPDLIGAFNHARPRDINVCCGVGTGEGVRELYVMFPPTVSTFSTEFRDINVARGCKLVRTEKVEFLSLATLLQRHLPKDSEIDFLSMDAEGFDFDVVQSNDWTKYRPKVVCIESPSQFFPSPVKNTNFRLHSYLDKHGYDLAYHSGMDAFFVRRD